ncbi:Transcription initiation factor IIF subunit beta [Mycena kentingensis (nom. inval.)]|nr:Transcription initiation factor IIF subunit beta [Mycena kentingensis (nom. inval.)]
MRTTVRDAIKATFIQMNSLEEKLQDKTLVIPSQDLKKVWHVRIPQHLLERWTAVEEENVQLATLRIYSSASAKNPRVFLFLPPNIDPNTGKRQPNYEADRGRPPFDFPTHYAVDSGAEPDCYELTVTNDNVQNEFIVATKEDSETRNSYLVAQIKRTANICLAALTPGYREMVRERGINANTPVRQTKILERAGVSQGAINHMTSAVGLGANQQFRDLVTAKPARGQSDRMVRMPRSELLDILFRLFHEQAYWTTKNLRDCTQQPEAYLKEVASSIAHYHRFGEHLGMWELDDTYKENANPRPAGSFSSESTLDWIDELDAQLQEALREDEDVEMEVV